jgi:GNAT superfamily N-acetyltransferase
MHPLIRTARVEDYPLLHHIRMAVKENTLSNPNLVTGDDYRRMTTDYGKGWVYNDGELKGFAFVDLRDNNIWALFVHPDYEKQGIGRILHDTMVEYCRQQGISNLWLTTSPDTRAEVFYRRAGWKSTGMTSSGEVRFELSLI